MPTEIIASIEEDGTVTLVSKAVAKEIHVQADEMYNEIARLLGGPRTATPNADKYQRINSHDHVHTH